MSPKSLTSALVLSLLFSSAVLGLPVTDATTKTPALGAQGTTPSGQTGATVQTPAKGKLGLTTQTPGKLPGSLNHPSGKTPGKHPKHPSTHTDKKNTNGVPKKHKRKKPVKGAPKNPNLKGNHGADGKLSTQKLSGTNPGSQTPAKTPGKVDLTKAPAGSNNLPGQTPSKLSANNPSSQTPKKADAGLVKRAPGGGKRSGRSKNNKKPKKEKKQKKVQKEQEEQEEEK